MDSTNHWTLERRAGGGGKRFRERVDRITKGSQNKVEFLEPFFDRNALKKEMEKATYFIYPSEAKEGETFGLAVLEAMSCGCIPVVSALPCFTDFISFEEEGFCLKQGINMNMEEAILEALPKILALNESQTSKLGLTAWKRSKEYELEKVAQAYLEDFTSLL